MDAPGLARQSSDVSGCVIGTGRVSGLRMWLRSATGRYGVRELGVQIELSDCYVLDLYMVFPKLNVISAPIIVCRSPHFTGPTCRLKQAEADFVPGYGVA